MEFQLDNLDTQVLLMGHEIITKEGERNRLTQELEERKIQEENMVRPKLEGLHKDIQVLELEIKMKINSEESCRVQKVELEDNISVHKLEIYKLEKEVEELTKDANEKKSDPKS